MRRFLRNSKRKFGTGQKKINNPERIEIVCADAFEWIENGWPAHSDLFLFFYCPFDEETFEVQSKFAYTDFFDRQASTLNAAPAAVTLITAEEIAHSGARDLSDVLRAIPGFNFTWEGQGAFSPTSRGLTGSSNVLILLDDITLNDELYAVHEFGRRYPIDMIERIEILRGPGSTRYGGRAGGAVIKISTKNSAKSQPQATLAYGQQSRGTPEDKFEGIIGGNIAAADVGVLVSARDSALTDRKWTDQSGSQVDLKGHEGSQDIFSLSKLNVGHFSATVLSDNYYLDDQRLNDQTFVSKLLSHGLSQLNI